MAHQAITPAFHDLIDLDTPVRQLGSGFTFTEGPIWHPRDHFLLFSDMPGDTRRRWDRHGVREVAKPSNKGNGMTYDRDLNLLICEHSTSSVVRIDTSGQRQVLASHFDGLELNSPNDIIVHSSGAIYFTDPWYGRMPGFGIERPRQLGFQGVYRIEPGGSPPKLLVDRYLFDQPNGLCFSPDERLLYVNDTTNALVRVFQVKDDGSLDAGRVLASGIKDPLKPGVPDGMKCDAQGNIWVTAPGGLWVFSAAGRLMGKIAIPELAANFHWGGEDFRELFVCASTSLYCLRTKVGPRPEPFMKAQAAPSTSSSAPTPTAAANSAKSALEKTNELRLDPSRCALIIQDMQNDVVMDGGAFAASGSPEHCRQQNNIANIQRLAEACRRAGVMVIHVWFTAEPGHAGLTQNCPLFEGAVDANALVRGSWGAAPVPGLEPQPGDFTVTKMRMSAFEGTTLETVLKSGNRDILINTGAWTNMSVEHTSRTAADKGFVVVVPEDGCSTMNGEWHQASINYALQNVAAVTDCASVVRAFSG